MLRPTIHLTEGLIADRPCDAACSADSIPIMEQLDAWHDFNVAMTGATAALAGLVIVAASVNIGDIIKATSLTARLAAGIASLVLALAVSALGLVPEFSDIAYGVSALVLAIGSGAFQGEAARRIYENDDPGNELKFGKAVLGFLPPLLYATGGILLMLSVPAGLVLFAFGAVVAIITALLVSWVVLVEVLR